MMGVDSDEKLNSRSVGKDWAGIFGNADDSYCPALKFGVILI
jgi:hypothetical protein